jgi:hypothetical protein
VIKTSYLELQHGQWRVTVSVPRPLQKRFGTRLKRQLGTDSLTEANTLKWPVVAELKARIEAAKKDEAERPWTFADLMDA